MDDKQKVMDKIKKLLALSQSPNEHEAISAAEKAQALLAEYNLTEADLKETTVGENFTIDSSIETDSVPWRRQLAVGVAQLYFCKYYYTHKYLVTASRKNGYIRRDTHSFVGQRHNIAVAKAMFEYLNSTIERLASEAGVSQPVRGRSSYVTSFKHGCARRVGSRLYKRYLDAKAGKVQTEGGRNLPALLSLYEQNEGKLDAYITAEVGQLGKAKSRAQANDMRGLLDGAKAGDRIGLDQQVDSSRAKNLLR